jgi:hypothetical protein
MIYMTSEEAGRVIGVSSAFIRYLARKGTLTSAATTGRGVYLFDPIVVKEFARKRKRAQESERLSQSKTD